MSASVEACANGIIALLSRWEDVDRMRALWGMTEMLGRLQSGLIYKKFSPSKLLKRRTALCFVTRTGGSAATVEAILQDQTGPCNSLVTEQVNWENLGNDGRLVPLV